MTISREQYFQAKPHTEEQGAEAASLLMRVNGLCEKVEFDWPVCPNTGTNVSGSKGGQGDGGFRLPGATTGADHSSHKTAQGVDVFDPQAKLDDAISAFDKEDGTNELLEEFGLYREAPGSTPGWCHLTTRAPHSGHRTFQP